MSGRFVRIRLAAAALLRQNRILIPLLVGWPLVLTGILMAAEQGRPAPGDAVAVLQQQLLYGLALVALRASSALGAEQKAGRLPQLLGRALGRGEYLASLGAATLLPFLGYLIVWAGNAILLGRLSGSPHLPILAPAVTVLSLGILTCSAGLLCSALLPQLAATTACGVLLAAGLVAGSRGAPGFEPLYAAVFGGQKPVTPWLPAVVMILLATLLYAAAVAVFRRRDLRFS